MAGRVETLKPVLTAHLFRGLEGMLVELLRSLEPPDWEKQTIAPRWKVKDVAAHLLDTQLRKLSICRDGYAPGPADEPGPFDLVAFINRLNEAGVRLFRRLSPEILIGLMEAVSPQFCAFHEGLDPFAPSVFAVSWAGEEKSLNWFDTAREFTERWHHQQQIRQAVERPGIMVPRLYHPVLDCFMRGLPFAYREIDAPPGTLARFDIAGPCGGSWFLYRDTGYWRLIDAPEGEPASVTTIPEEIAWRIFTKGIDRASAEAQVRVTGERWIGLHVLGMISIVG
ncbi:MAG: maleylpyruvate isomerase N-terminal domain-containing protein [Acidobacteria bacterium]|nr:maleylpyruvate isomerase N-terminal domain-containing protein [Acidobacteriota bacterium]